MTAGGDDMATNEPRAGGGEAEASRTAHPDDARWASLQYVVLGLVLLIVGGVVFATTVDGALTASPMDDTQEPAAGLIIAGILVAVGGTMTLIGAIAKGIELGNRERR